MVVQTGLCVELGNPPIQEGPGMTTTTSVSRDNVAAGIGWMLVTTFLFVCGDSVGKYLLQSYPLMQVAWCRFLFHFLIALAVALVCFRDTLRANRPFAQIGRSALLAILTVLFLVGLRSTDLSTAFTIIFTSPLFVTLFSGMLGERVGLRVGIGALVGFLGAVIVVRPGLMPFSLGMLCLLASAILNALFQLVTRHLRHADKPMTTSLYTAVAGAVMLLPTGLYEWQMPDTGDWFLFLAFGFFGGLAQLCMIRAFHLAQAAAVAPFSYSSIVWATIFGLVIFGQLPDIWTLVGAALIVSSGLYIFHCERNSSAGGAAAALTHDRPTEGIQR